MRDQVKKVRTVAKKYLKRGWKIVPIKNGCKYPQVKEWQKLNIAIDEIDTYFKDDITNIGILTGDPYVIDLDMNPWGDLDWQGKTKHPWGDNEWDKLDEAKSKKHKEHKFLFEYERKYGNTNHFANGKASSLNTWQGWLDENNDGKPLNTPTSKTGSGGQQIFVRLPKEVELTQSSKKIHPSIDTRTTGGQVVVSPSIHPNGKKYEWIINPETPVMDCPAWLLEKLQGHNWRNEFREDHPDIFVESSTDNIDNLWENRKTGSAVKELVEDNYFIRSGCGRKAALCSIAGYWSMKGYVGDALVQKVLPHLSRMETDRSDPVDEKRVVAICKWVDNKNCHKVNRKSATQTKLDGILNEFFQEHDDFPLDSLPEIIQKYISRKSEQLGVPPELLGGGVLCIFAGAIGTTYGIQITHSWKEPAILWHVVLADTGSKKTACFNAVWDIAKEKEHKVNEHNRLLQKMYEKEKLVFEKNVSKFKDKGEDAPTFPDSPSKRILKISDTTYEYVAGILGRNSDGTSIFRTEILGWIEGSTQYSKGTNGSRTFYLESYDGGSYTMTRISSGETYIPRNHINVWGYSQTKSFTRLLKNEKNVEDGFAPRFLLSNPGPFPISSQDGDDHLESLEVLKEAYASLVDIEPEYEDKRKKYPITQYLRFNKEAQRKWVKFHKQYEKITNAFFIGRDHYFMPWWSKFPGQVARLILVIHIIRWKSGETSSFEIDAVSIVKGVKLGRFFLANAFKTVARKKDNPNYIPYHKEYDKIVKWVQNNKSAMEIRTMVRNRCFQNSSEAKGALDLWEKEGLGLFVDEKKTLFVPINQA